MPQPIARVEAIAGGCVGGGMGWGGDVARWREWKVAEEVEEEDGGGGGGGGLNEACVEGEASEEGWSPGCGCLSDEKKIPDLR
jgi:hypothetical protein